MEVYLFNYLTNQLINKLTILINLIRVNRRNPTPAMRDRKARRAGVDK